MRKKQTTLLSLFAIIAISNHGNDKSCESSTSEAPTASIDWCRAHLDDKKIAYTILADGSILIRMSASNEKNTSSITKEKVHSATWASQYR